MMISKTTPKCVFNIKSVKAICICLTFSLSTLVYINNSQARSGGVDVGNARKINIVKYNVLDLKNEKEAEETINVLKEQILDLENLKVNKMLKDGVCDKSKITFRNVEQSHYFVKHPEKGLERQDGVTLFIGLEACKSPFEIVDDEHIDQKEY